MTPSPMPMPGVLTTVASTQPYPLVFATVSGAHLYGFPSADSDFDLRGVHVLPAAEVVGIDTGPETIEVSEDTSGIELDLVTHDLRKFCLMLLRRNGYVLEQLLSPLVIATSPWHDELIALAPACVTSRHAHHYLGFAATQWKLFEKEQPRRLKPLLYEYRVLMTGIHLMRTGTIEANLVTLNEQFRIDGLAELVERKRSAEQVTIDDLEVPVHEMRCAALRSELEDAMRATSLPDQPSARPALHDLVVRARLGGG